MIFITFSTIFHLYLDGQFNWWSGLGKTCYIMLYWVVAKTHKNTSCVMICLDCICIW